ncbi:MAG TPA: SulP family inorganic anion transporter [Burkholderiales bacterium]|nr:SulP family inorganic anion transporter [Burkholderiales bacterium]
MLTGSAAAPNVRALLLRFLPFLAWWPRVNRVSVRADLMAGATGALIVLPQGVAFATIAGMPPEYGLYAAIVPTIIAALFGSSWHLMAGPTTATSIVIFSTMSAVSSPFSNEYVQLVLTMSLIAGCIKLTMGLMRLGVLVNLVSQTVIVGFTSGAGILIVAGQLQYFLGLSIPRGLGFGETLRFIVLRANDIDWYIASVAGITLLAALGLKRRYPRSPYLIAAMAAGGVYAYLLRFVPGFSAAHHIPTLATLPGPVPHFAPPRMSFEVLRKTMSPAVAVAIVGLTEAMSIARAIGARSEQRINANQEFIGQGLANITGAFFSAYAASGSLNRSGLNYEAGAKTPLSAIFSAVFLVLALVAIAPLARYLPEAAMAGVLMLVGWALIDFRYMRKVLRVGRSETIVLTVTLAATLFGDLAFAIYLGVILSLMLYLLRTSHPHVFRSAMDAASYEGLREVLGLPPGDRPTQLIRIRGSIYFGAAQHVLESLLDLALSADSPPDVIVDLSRVNFIDTSGARVLAEVALRVRRGGASMYLCGVNNDVRHVLVRSGRIREIGRRNVVAAPAPPLYAVTAPSVAAAQDA